MRIGVTGGRHFADENAVAAAMSLLPADATLVHGAARGADKLCAEWWKTQGRPDDPHPAPWDAPCTDLCQPNHRRTNRLGASYCPAAGVYRNAEMVESGLDLLVAFPGNEGTLDMIRRCKAASVPIVRTIV